jgi:hypothetical protein
VSYDLSRYKVAFIGNRQPVSGHDCVCAGHARERGNEIDDYDYDDCGGVCRKFFGNLIGPPFCLRMGHKETKQCNQYGNGSSYKSKKPKNNELVDSR